MVTELRFFVEGIPATQGSMRCLGVNRATGRHMVVPDNPPKLKAWRDTVITRCAAAARHIDWQPLDCAEVRMIFRLARPANHYRTGRYSHLLRDDAPAYPATKPDVDKLIRAVFDSLTYAKVITDDAVIVTETAAKRYADLDRRPGVNIVLGPPPAPQPALFTEPPC